jgi:hypothetical protein
MYLRIVLVGIAFLISFFVPVLSLADCTPCPGDVVGNFSDTFSNNFTWSGNFWDNNLPLQTYIMTGLNYIQGCSICEYSISVSYTCDGDFDDINEEVNVYLDNFFIGVIGGTYGELNNCMTIQESNTFYPSFSFEEVEDLISDGSIILTVAPEYLSQYCSVCYVNTNINISYWICRIKLNSLMIIG